MPATFLFELDADGITRFVSAEVVDLTGYAPSELVGRDFWGVLCPAELRAQITLGRDGSLPVAGTQRLVILSKAGALTPRDVHLAYRQGADRVGSWLGSMICPPRPERFYLDEGTHQMLDSLGVPLHIVDSELRFLFVNQTFIGYCKQLNLPIDVLGKSLTETYSFLKDGVEAEYQQVFDTGQLMLTHESTSMGDRQIHTVTRKIPYMLDNQTVCVVTVIQDISARVNAENELSAAASRYRSLFEDAAIPILEEDFSAVKRALDEVRSGGVDDLAVYLAEHPEFVLQAAGMIRLIDANQAALNLYGAGSKDELPKCLQPLLVPEAIIMLQNELLAIATAERYFEGEMINQTLQGAPLHVQLTMTIPAEGEVFQSALVCVFDISLRKLAEQALAENEAKFRSIVESSPMGMHMYHLEPDGRLIFSGANPAADRLLSVDNNAFIGKTIEEAFPPLQATEVPERYRRACAFGETWSTLQIDYQDDQIRGAFEVHAFQTSPGNMVALFLEITDRIQTEHALRASEQRYRSLFEKLPVGLYRSTPEGRLLDANPAFLSLTGFPDMLTLLDMPMQRLYIDPAERQRWQAKVESEEGSRGWEVEWLRWDGKSVWVRDTAQATRDESGRVVYYEGIAEDITETKAAQAALQRRFDELSVLHSIATSAASSTSLDQLLDQTVEVIGGKLYRDKLGIMLLDRDSGILHLHPSYHGPIRDEKFHHIPIGKGITGLVAQEGQIRRIPDVRKEPHYLNADPQTRSELCVPIILGDEVLGVMDVESDLEDAFSQEDERLLVTLAGQLAAAIQRVRLYEELQNNLTALKDRNIELSRLYRALGALLSSATPDLPSVGRAIVETVLREIGQSNCGLFLLGDGPEIRLIADAGAFKDEMIRQSLTRDGPGIVPATTRSGNLLNIPDVLNYPTYVMGWASARSELCVPLKIGEQVIGALDIQSKEINAFGPDDERLMSIFAEHASLALENARLFEQTRRRAREFSALYETTRDLAGKQDLASLLQDIIDQATSLFDINQGVIYLYDPNQQELVLSAAKGMPIPVGKLLRQGEGGAGRVAQTRLPLIIEDYQDWAGRTLIFDDYAVSSMLVVPMLYAGELVGVLSVNELHPVLRKFSQADERLLTLFAGHAAAAVHSTRLFDATRRHLAELETVSRVSSVLRASESLDEMLPQLLDETLAAIGTDAGLISLFDSLRSELVQMVSRGWFKNIPPMRLKLGEGIAGHVLMTNLVYSSDNFAEDANVYPGSKPLVPPGWGGACVPIRTAQTVVGVMFVSVQSPRTITPSEINLLTTLAEIAGNSIQRMRLFEKTEQRLRHIITLRAIDQAINASVDLRLTMDILLSHLTTQLRVDAACVLLLNPYTHSLEYTTGRGFHSTIPPYTSIRMGDSHAGRAALERQTVHLTDLDATQDRFKLPLLAREERFVSYYALPLIAKGQVKGVLEIYHRTALEADPEWLDFLESLAGQAAIAIDNASLFESLQQTNLELVLAYDATIEGWSAALDLRDRETEGHTQRVVELTLRLARAWGFNEDEVVHIRRGALLHDIGKMGIPDNILQKPGPLTEQEWEVMRRHPVYAYRFLAPITFLKPALDIPYCHHEYWDGQGYPRGLRGEHIPLSARLFAVVDNWDALLSDRPYRAAWPIEEVRQYLREQAGQRFDPRVVDSFFQIVDLL